MALLQDYLIALNDYSVNIRYPGFMELSVEDKEEALAAADYITKYVKGVLV